MRYFEIKILMAIFLITVLTYAAAQDNQAEIDKQVAKVAVGIASHYASYVFNKLAIKEVDCSEDF